MDELPPGAEEYVADSTPVRARGHSYSQAEVETALGERIAGILWDDAGREEIAQLLEGMAATEFAQDRLDEILGAEPNVEDWRVGEAFAEAYLVDHCACSFPWPGGRDVKNPKASPPGCDLVGFEDDGKKTRLALGEAKTSSQDQAPPSVVFGRHGLQKQLEALRDSPRTKDRLLMYLAFHAGGKPWEGQFRAAAGAYLTDPTDVALFGVLVRDTDPNEKDLTGRAAALAKGCPKETTIELRAMYLPPGIIDTLPDRVREARRSDAA